MVGGGGGGGGSGGEVFFVDGNGDALAATMPHFLTAGNSKSCLRSAKKSQESLHIGRSTEDSRFVSSGETHTVSFRVDGDLKLSAETSPPFVFQNLAVPINHKSRPRSSNSQQKTKTPARLRYGVQDFDGEE